MIDLESATTAGPPPPHHTTGTHAEAGRSSHYAGLHVCANIHATKQGKKVQDIVCSHIHATKQGKNGELCHDNPSNQNNSSNCSNQLRFAHGRLDSFHLGGVAHPAMRSCTGFTCVLSCSTCRRCRWVVWHRCIHDVASPCQASQSHGIKRPMGMGGRVSWARLDGGVTISVISCP